MTVDDSTVMKHVIAALVSNEPGVLAHIAGMFAARGFNIDSLVVGRTENPELSRMTIVVNGTMKTLEQVRKQLAKVVEVVKVVDYLGTDHVERDLMLVRVATPAAVRSEVIELASLFRARIVDVGREELMIELSGIVELARTGVIAMPRAEKVEGKSPTRRRRAAGRGGSADKGNKPVTDVDPKDLPPG
jgi:acetolactate synthase I/III small subunit